MPENTFDRKEQELDIVVTDGKQKVKCEEELKDNRNGLRDDIATEKVSVKEVERTMVCFQAENVS